MPKFSTHQRLLYAGLIIGLIALTSGATYLVTSQNLLEWQLNSRSQEESTAHLYGLFAGHGVCEQAIKDAVQGKLITLESEDRAAKYNAYDDSNVLTFNAEIKPDKQRFLSEQRSTYKIMYRCHTSSVDNRLLKLSQLVVDELGIK
jgi:hypothetical protein